MKKPARGGLFGELMGEWLWTFLAWFETLPGVQYGNRIIESSGINPGWLGYLIALPIILAITRRNK